MLEQKDFELLKNMMESVMKGTEESILEKVDGKLEKTEKSILEKVDELNRNYRITKLESDNTALLLKLIDDLSKRVEELEKRTA